MSKATLIVDGESLGDEKIHLLELGKRGEAAWSDNDLMLTSAIYIDNEGMLWFGQRAIEKFNEEDEGGNRQIIDSVKRSISEGGLDRSLDAKRNSTDIEVTYADMVLANLMFLTWSVNLCLKDLGFKRNVKRRFAMPCLDGENEKEAKHLLTEMLGQAQILSDSFFDSFETGVPLKRFMSYVEELKEKNYNYDYVGRELTEPLGVAGSRMSFDSEAKSTFMVVDVGAGTTDFGLFRVTYKPEAGQLAAFQANGSEEYLPVAGNHIDSLLRNFILKKAGVASDHPRYLNILSRLQLQIRGMKESLFTLGYTSATLHSGEYVDVQLQEFLTLDQVLNFQDQIRTKLTDIINAVDGSWIESLDGKPLGIILTGGGAKLPMIEKATKGQLTTNHGLVSIEGVNTMPKWLEEHFPDLEDYSRIAVSLGGAREHLISRTGVSNITAGPVKSLPKLDGYFVQGPVEDK